MAFSPASASHLLYFGYNQIRGTAMAREPHTVQVLIKVRPSQKLILEQASIAADMSMSEFIRSSAIARAVALAEEEPHP